jgi:hypothetical protein
MKHLTVFGRMGWCCQNKCASFSSKKENTVALWAFKLTIAFAATAKGHLKGCVLKKVSDQFSAVVFYAIDVKKFLLRVLAFT